MRVLNDTELDHVAAAGFFGFRITRNNVNVQGVGISQQQSGGFGGNWNSGSNNGNSGTVYL